MKNVSKDTIIRTIVTFIALVNSVLTMIGKNPVPFSDDEVYLFFSTLLSVFSTLWAWWKNNSFTSAAIAGDIVKDEVKGKGYTE